MKQGRRAAWRHRLDPWRARAAVTNHAYIGETRHRDQHFPGEHEAIIAAELWDSVQTLFATNRIERGSDRNLRHEPLLRGILFEGLGRRMQAAQANRGATRYRYYITNPADAATKPGRSCRLPATDLDKIVQRRVTAFLRDSAALYVAITSIGLSAVALASVIAGPPRYRNRSTSAHRQATSFTVSMSTTIRSS